MKGFCIVAIVKKITDEMIVKGKGIIDYYMLRGILPVARSWPKRRKTPFRPRELEAQGVFGILSKSTTFIQDKVKEAWVVESIGKRPRWQDTYIGLGMKYWGINGEIPPILLDYQIHWHTPNPELELLLQKIEAKYGKTEAQEIQSTGIVNIEDIEEYREKLYFTLYDTKGIRLIAPFLEFIIGKGIDFTIALQKLAGFIVEPEIQACFTKANVRIPDKKTYYYHGVKYECVIEFDPTPMKCFPVKGKGPSGEHIFKIYSGEGEEVTDAHYIVTEKSDDYTYEEVRDWEEAFTKPYKTAVFLIGQGYDYKWWNTWEIYRGGICFKNTVIKPDFEMKEAELVFRVFFKPIVKDFDVVIQRGIELEDDVPVYPSQPPVGTDFNRFLYGFVGGSKNTSEMGPKYSQFSIKLNGLGLSWINKTDNGITKFMLRSSDDITGIPPEMENMRKECCQLYSGEIYGDYYRSHLKFTVTVYIPEVETREVINIGREEVTWQGYIINHHGWLSSYGFEFADYVAGPFEYIEVGKDELQDIKLYMYDKNGLTPDTPYFVRARAENEAGIGRGEWVEFRTLP